MLVGSNVGASCQKSTDVRWQLAKDADGPDGKMKNMRKFGFGIFTSDKKIGNLGN